MHDLIKFPLNIIPIIILSLGYFQAFLVGILVFLFKLIKPLFSKKRIIQLLWVINIILLIVDFCFCFMPLVKTNDAFYDEMYEYVSVAYGDLGYQNTFYYNFYLRLILFVVNTVFYFVISKFKLFFKSVRLRIKSILILLMYVLLILNIFYLFKNYHELQYVKNALDVVHEIVNSYPNFKELLANYFANF